MHAKERIKHRSQQLNEATIIWGVLSIHHSESPSFPALPQLRGGSNPQEF